MWSTGARYLRTAFFISLRSLFRSKIRCLSQNHCIWNALESLQVYQRNNLRANGSASMNTFAISVLDISGAATLHDTITRNIPSQQSRKAHIYMKHTPNLHIDAKECATEHQAQGQCKVQYRSGARHFQINHMLGPSHSSGWTKRYHTLAALPVEIPESVYAVHKFQTRMCGEPN